MSGPMVVAKPKDNVPIVGQPYDIKGWFVTIMIECKCEKPAHFLLAGNIGAFAQCPNCKGVVQLAGLEVQPNNDVNFSLIRRFDLGDQQS